MTTIHELTTEQHWEYLAEFTRLEIQAGGPDSHMVVVGHMSRDVPLLERMWRMVCYIAAYNAPSGEVLWQHWPLQRALEEGQQFENWMRENWKGVATRRERRCVRTPQKFSRFFLDAARWLDERGTDLLDETDYEVVWEEAERVKFLGRYVRFKLLEAWHRYCGLRAKLPDTRPAGAWSPRRTLSLMFPKWADVLDKGGNSVEILETVDSTVNIALDRLRKQYDLDMDYYVFEVMLCDYRQTFYRQYPGRSHDSELEYAHQIAPYWPGRKTEMFKARAEIFPAEHLGELQGWQGVRKELWPCMSEHGYYWTDMRYDYAATTDLAHPVLRR